MPSTFHPVLMRLCTFLCTLLLALTATAQTKPAPAYPTKPIKIIVPYAPGGTSLGSEITTKA